MHITDNFIYFNILLLGKPNNYLLRTVEIENRGWSEQKLQLFGFIFIFFLFSFLIIFPAQFIKVRPIFFYPPFYPSIVFSLELRVILVSMIIITTSIQRPIVICFVIMIIKSITAPIRAEQSLVAFDDNHFLSTVFACTNYLFHFTMAGYILLLVCNNLFYF